MSAHSLFHSFILSFVLLCLHPALFCSAATLRHRDLQQSSRADVRTRTFHPSILVTVLLCSILPHSVFPITLGLSFSLVINPFLCCFGRRSSYTHTSHPRVCIISSLLCFLHSIPPPLRRSAPRVASYVCPHRVYQYQRHLSFHFTRYHLVYFGLFLSTSMFLSSCFRV